MESTSSEYVPNSVTINQQFPSSSSGEVTDPIKLSMHQRSNYKFDVGEKSIVNNEKSTSSEKNEEKVPNNSPEMKSQPIVVTKTFSYKSIGDFWADWHKIIDIITELKERIIASNERLANFVTIKENFEIMQAIKDYPELPFYKMKALYLNECKYFKTYILDFKEFQDTLTSFETTFKTFILQNSDFVDANINVENQMNYKKTTTKTTKLILTCKQLLSSISEKYNSKILAVPIVNHVQKSRSKKK